MNRYQLKSFVDAAPGEIVAGVLATVRPDIGETAMVPLADAVRRAGESIRPVVSRVNIA